MDRLTDWAEGLLCPAILCDPSGKILYRNAAAKRCRMAGRTGLSLLPLLPEADAAEYVSAASGRRCTILAVPAEDGERQVLLCPVALERKRLTLLLGYAMLQSARFDRAEGRRRLAAAGAGLSDWLLCREPQSAPVLPGGIRLYDLHAKMLTMYLCDLFTDRPERLSVLSGFLDCFSGNEYAFCGAALSVEVQMKDPDSVFLSESGTYLAALIAVCQAAVLSGGFRRGKCSFYLQDERLIARLDLGCGSKPLPELFPETPEKAVEAFPEISAELLFLAGLCRSRSYGLRAFKAADELHLFFSSPMYIRRDLHAGDIPELPLSDAVAAFAAYFGKFLLLS